MSSAVGSRAAILALTLSGACMAQTATPRPPEWSGVWRVQGSPALISTENGKMWQRGVVNDAPLKPQYLAEYHALAERALKQGHPDATDAIVDSNTLNCFAGMPRFIAMPFSYTFHNEPGETWIISDKEVREIFTDGRDWPEPDMRWPLMLGRSRGRWEGDTLIVETVDMRDDLWLDPTALMLSDQASVVERLRKTDADTIENRVTITDPVKFTKPWSFTRHYKRQPYNRDRWPDDPELCGGPTDRNPIVDGKVTVKLPGDPPASKPVK
jgi:hypothetical protein